MHFVAEIQSSACAVSPRISRCVIEYPSHVRFPLKNIQVNRLHREIRIPKSTIQLLHLIAGDEVQNLCKTACYTGSPQLMTGIEPIIYVSKQDIC